MAINRSKNVFAYVMVGLGTKDKSVDRVCISAVIYFYLCGQYCTFYHLRPQEGGGGGGGGVCYEYILRSTA